ncbi:MAG: MBL fold metallo-hydrolase [Rhodoferax sp.]|nr:MBL fold metallo-hydrolase [Rhodoferax sp.]
MRRLTHAPHATWWLAWLLVAPAMGWARVPDGPDTPAAIQVAPGVFMVAGAAGEPGPDNLGRTGNSGFIVGRTGVVAIDTGTSYRQGLALLAGIRRVTAKPVVLALVTHARQEFLFGATAFQSQGIPVHMQRQAAGMMRERCDHCLQTLHGLLGADAMQGTQLFKPDQEFEEPYTRDVAGRRIRVLGYGHSAGPGDVAVLDEQTGVLFAGGLLDYQRIPDVQDSDLPAWSAALQALQALPLTAVVPGHGPVGPPDAIAAVARYLAQLQQRVLALMQTGTSLLDVGAAASLPEFAAWDQYRTVHRRNAAVVYLRLEREHLFGRP